jgi:ABC-type nitrate/sulfonate/bicarbonate transport system permease component
MQSNLWQIIVKRVLQAALAVAIIVMVWQVAVIGFGVPAYIVPLPLAVTGAFVSGWGTIASHTGFTLLASGLGLAVSALFASAIAVAFSVNRTLEQTSMPIVLVFRATPVAAVAPLVTLFLGRGINTSIVVVTIISFFPILVNLMRGIAASDPNAAELLHVYGATQLQQMRLVRIPFALPYLFTGLRVSGTSAILGAMLSEWITGSPGLGKLILDSGEMRETEMLWASVLTSVIVALFVFWTTSAAEKALLRWKT